MKVIKNKNYKPHIYKKEIRYLEDDYEFHLEDLNNYIVKYDELSKEVYVVFDTIYVYNIEKLIAINYIVGSFKNYRLNGYYEREEYKTHNITIGKDIIDYLYIWEKDYLKKKGINE